MQIIVDNTTFIYKQLDTSIVYHKEGTHTYYHVELESANSLENLIRETYECD